jgi:hypothetical protein
MIKKNITINNIINILKKYNNFESFSKDYLKIISKDMKVESFLFNKEQQYILKLINKQYKNEGVSKTIILKSRQVGSSTLLSALMFYNLLNSESFRGFVLTHRQSATNNLFNIFYRFFNFLPQDLQMDLSITKSKNLSVLGTNCSAGFATAGGSEVGRSETISFFLGSEVAFWPNSQNHISSVLSAVVPQNSHIILESTSAGASGAFYEMCMEASLGKNDFQLIFLPWYWHKNYSTKREDSVIEFPIDWLEYQKIYGLTTEQLNWAYIKNKDINLSSQQEAQSPSELFLKEFPGSIEEAFKSGNTNNLISLSNIQKVAIYNEDFFNKQEFVKLLNKFKMQSKLQGLVLGIDIAFGGKDSSYIIDKVGGFLGFNINHKIKSGNSTQLIAIIKKYIEQFNIEKICLDTSGGGILVYDALCRENLEHLLLPVNFANKSNDSDKFINIRAEIWYLLKQFIEEGNYIIKDVELIKQLSSINYFHNAKGQIQLEDKVAFKQRIKQSPDAADAAALTFAYNPYKNFIHTKHTNTDYNPYKY